MSEPRESAGRQDRTTIVTTGGANGVGWFIAGGLAVLAIVAVWLFGGVLFDRAGPAGVTIDVPENVEVEVDRAPAPEATPEPDADAAPAPDAAPEPEAAPEQSE